MPLTVNYFSLQLTCINNPSVMLKELKLNGSMKTKRPSRTNIQKRYSFHHRGLECKTRKSRDTWSNKQIWPLSTK